MDEVIRDRNEVLFVQVLTKLSYRANHGKTLEL